MICLRYVNFNHARKSLLIYFVINNRECQNIFKVGSHNQSISVRMPYGVWEVFLSHFVYVEILLDFRMHFWEQRVAGSSDNWQHKATKKKKTVDCETIADVNQNHAVPITLSAHPLIKYISIFKMKIIYWHFRRDAEALGFVAGSVNKQIWRWMCAQKQMCLRRRWWMMMHEATAR